VGFELGDGHTHHLKDDELANIVAEHAQVEQTQDVENPELELNRFEVLEFDVLKDLVEDVADLFEGKLAGGKVELLVDRELVEVEVLLEVGLPFVLEDGLGVGGRLGLGVGEDVHVLEFVLLGDEAADADVGLVVDEEGVGVGGGGGSSWTAIWWAESACSEWRDSMVPLRGGRREARERAVLGR